MSYPSLRRLILKLVTLGVLVTCLAFFTDKPTHSRFAAATPQVFTVQIESQPDSPLQITSTRVISSDPFSPSVEFTVTNKGSRGIRAYTVSYELVAENGSRKGAFSPT